MNTPLRRFVTDFSQAVQQAALNQSVQLGKGQCPNFETYQRNVGRIDGMKAAADLALDMLRKVEMDDDDGSLPDMPPGDAVAQRRGKKA